jgi:hypothetical protein
MSTRYTQDESNEDGPTVSFPRSTSRSRYAGHGGYGQQNLSSPEQRLNLENPPTVIWPRRLLHVESMAVYTRTSKESTCYLSEGGETRNEPPYNIISYTWGRFQARGDTSVIPLQVKGIEWAIPVVESNKAFNIGEFRDVGWILGYHSASLSPSAGQGRGDPNPPTCAYIYLSVDLLYSAIESSFPTDTRPPP